MPKFYITYGMGSNLSNCFSSLEAGDYGQARVAFQEATFGKFAFCYNEEEFAGQQERWGLTEVPVQPQVMGY